MKYKERTFKPEEPIKDSKNGITIYDGKGNEYEIQLNEFGELSIISNDGSLMVSPRYSNQVLIKSE